MPLILTDNNEGNFADISSNVAVNNFVEEQMRNLMPRDVSDIVYIAFQGSQSGVLFCGIKNDPATARADVTPSSNSTVKIQIQQNYVRPSPTYATLIVDNSIKRYLDLESIPLPQNEWSINIQNLAYRSKKEKLSLVDKINSSIDRYNFTRKKALEKQVPNLPDVLQYVSIDTLDTAENVHTNYDLLRTVLINYRAEEKNHRLNEVGEIIIQGLHNSLHFKHTYTLSYQ